MVDELKRSFYNQQTKPGSTRGGCEGISNMTKRLNKAKKDSQLKLVTPRRNWKRFDSVVGRRSGSRTSTIRSNIQREQRLASSHKRSNKSENISDGDDSDALRWIGSMIKRGRSILSSLTEEERAFELEMREDQRRLALHDRLVENILKRKDEDVSRNGYGTDTSFKHMNSTLYNSFVDSEDFNMDYSISEANNEVDEDLLSCQQASAVHAERSDLHSDDNDDIPGDEEHNIDSGEDLCLDNSAEDLGINVNPIYDDVVEVLSVDSQESQADEASEERNYTSEEEREGAVSDVGDEKGHYGRSSEQDDKSITRQSFSDEMSTEVNTGQSRPQVGDDVMANDEGHRGEHLTTFSNSTHEEGAEDPYVEVLSGEETSDEELGGKFADRETAASDETLTKLEDVNTAVDAEINIQGNQYDESSPPMSPDRSSPGLYGSSHDEGLKNDEASLTEAENFAELDNIEILDAQDLGQQITSSTNDELQGGIDGLINEEGSTEHQLSDIFDYKAIAQEARRKALLENDNGELEADESTHSAHDEATADQNENVNEAREDGVRRVVYGDEQGSDIKIKALENQQLMQNNDEAELNMNSLTPDLIEVKIDHEATDQPPVDEHIDVTISSVNETTIYHSFDGSNSGPTLTCSSSHNDEEKTGYQIVFEASAYSTTSYEDNGDIIEPTGEYVSPLTEDPFSIQKDGTAYEVLQRTLASLSRTGTEPAANDKKVCVADFSIDGNAEPVRISQVLQHETQYNPDISSSDSNRSNEEEISDYVTAVLEASRKTEGVCSSDNESSGISIEEMESNIVVASLPVIQTEPTIEILESTSRVLIPIAGDELQAEMATISEFVGDSDLSEDGLLTVVQTNPIIEIPSIERFETNSLYNDTLLRTDQIPRIHTTSSENQNKTRDTFANFDDHGFSEEIRHCGDQTNALLTSKSALLKAKTAINRDSARNEESIEEQIGADNASRSSKGRGPSFPRKLLSSPLRAISSLVSGIKEVGNVASNFVRTLDVLGNDDTEEASGDAESSNEESPNAENYQEDETKDGYEPNDLKPQKGQSMEPNELQFASNTYVENVSPPVVATRDVEKASIEIEEVEAVPIPDIEKVVVQEVNEAIIQDGVEAVEEDQVASLSSEYEDCPAETSLRYDTRADANPVESSAMDEQLVSSADDKEFSVPQMSTSEYKPEEIGNSAERDGTLDVQSLDTRNNTSPFASPAVSLGTSSQIRALQQLVDSVDRMPFNQQDQNEESELKIEEESLRNPVDIEVDPEIEIDVERSSTDPRALASSSLLETGSYPVESTLIAGVGPPTMVKEETPQATAQDTAHNQRPLHALHDPIRYKLPSYLPSDPPSEDDNEPKKKEVTEIQSKTQGLNGRMEASRSPSIDRKEPSDIEAVAVSAKNEDVKNIPVECDNRSSDTKIPVIIDKTPSPAVANDQHEELSGSGGDSQVDKLQATETQQVNSSSPKRKRPRSNIAGSGRPNKRNKKQFKGRRKGKKKGPVIRKKN